MTTNEKRQFAIGADRWAGASKVIEEAAEVTQVLAKLLATYGEREHWGDGDLVLRLEEELGDLKAAISFFLLNNPDVRGEVVRERASQKLRQFEEWHGEASGAPCEKFEWREVLGRASQKLRHALTWNGKHIATVEQSDEVYTTFMAFGGSPGVSTTLAAAKDLAETTFADARSPQRERLD